jgi:MFS family permease
MSNLPPPEVEIVTAEEEELQDEVPFLMQVGTAFVYPFKGAGVFILIGGTLMLIVSSFMAVWGPFGLFASAMVGGFLAAYGMRIITESGEGDDTPPPWPDVSDLRADILHPLWLFLVPAIIAMLPFLLYASEKTSAPPRTLSTNAWLLMAAGLAILPMMLLSVSMHDSLAGLNPMLLVRSIARTFPSYMVALVVLGLSMWLEVTLRGLLFDVSIWAGLIVSQSVWLYTLMVESRVLGLLYRTNREKLNWQV